MLIYLQLTISTNTSRFKSTSSQCRQWKFIINQIKQMLLQYNTYSLECCDNFLKHTNKFCIRFDKAGYAQIKAWQIKLSIISIAFYQITDKLIKIKKMYVVFSAKHALISYDSLLSLVMTSLTFSVESWIVPSPFFVVFCFTAIGNFWTTLH